MFSCSAFDLGKKGGSLEFPSLSSTSVSITYNIQTLYKYIDHTKIPTHLQPDTCQTLAHTIDQVVLPLTSLLRLLHNLLNPPILPTMTFPLKQPFQPGIRLLLLRLCHGEILAIGCLSLSFRVIWVLVCEIFRRVWSFAFEFWIDAIDRETGHDDLMMFVDVWEIDLGLWFLPNCRGALKR